MHFYDDVIKFSYFGNFKRPITFDKKVQLNWNFPNMCWLPIPKLAPKKFLDPALSGSKVIAEKLPLSYYIDSVLQLSHV